MAPEGEWEPCTLRDDVGLDEPDPRFSYLTLLRDGYLAIAKPVPEWLESEWSVLKTGEDIRVARLRAQEREAAKAERERRDEKRRAIAEAQEAPEASLEEHWHNMRQLGKTEAAERWADKYGVPLPEIIEVAETEEEMRDAIRNLRENARQAKRQQGLR